MEQAGTTMARLFVLAVLAAFALVNDGVPRLQDVTVEPHFWEKEISATANRKTSVPTRLTALVGP